MEKNSIYSGLMSHVDTFWPSEKKEVFSWEKGGIKSILPDFRVLRISPGKQGEPWVYLTLGAWEVDNNLPFRQEFLIISPYESPRHIETLAMLSSYYSGTANLSTGSCVNIGREWLEGATCTHLLISLPYPYGPELENYNSSQISVKYRWLLPIHSSEKDFLDKYGLEELEKRFDKNEMDYLDPLRASVVIE
ncbi:Suppressor of fused protein (SUFU) [Halomonas cupida]|nr:Suppressor of fused protein (SUFU) [Halomonas cupida]